MERLDERRSRLARGNSLQEATIVLERPTLDIKVDKKDPSLVWSGRHQNTQVGRPNGSEMEWKSSGEPNTSKLVLHVLQRTTRTLVRQTWMRYRESRWNNMMIWKRYRARNARRRQVSARRQAYKASERQVTSG